MDERDYRTGMMGIDATSKDISRNVKVEVLLDSRLPFIHTSQLSGTGPATSTVDTVADVVYNAAFSSALNSINPSTDIKNVLIDPNDPDRYITLALVGSLITQKECVLIYDSAFNDMILIPSLAPFGDSANTIDIMANNSIIVSGYQVGGGVTANTRNLAQSINQNLYLPTPNVLPDIKAHMFSSNGFITTGGSTNNKGQTFGDSYIESKNLSVLQFSSIGSSALLNGPIQAAIMAQPSPTNYCLFPGRVANYDDILIPILF